MSKIIFYSIIDEFSIPFIKVKSIKFNGVGIPRDSPRVIISPHNESISVNLFAIISCSIEHLLLAVDKTTSINRFSISIPDISIPDATAM